MNSWISPACYPRGSFYPVSHGPSTRYRGITKPYFRICSTRWSCSQAPLCLYTLWQVSILPEGTFGRLRYSFRRRPPQSNCPPGTVPRPDDGAGLGSKYNQGGISLTAPPRLTPQLQSLPPILHRSYPNTMPSCSKAPRGLFVLLRVGRIFTAISTSPGPLLRQCSDRYAVRAGRNLPDKEFRYLRTVIVTAAVHRGFSSKLRLR